jgi:hypothetical protein
MLNYQKKKKPNDMKFIEKEAVKELNEIVK